MTDQQFNQEVLRIKSLVQKLTPTDQELVLLESIKKKCLNDLYFFAKIILGYRDLAWSTHGSTIACLESATTRKLICLPRGAFKSSIGSVAYPIWSLLKNPDLRIYLDSEVYTNSKNLLRLMRTHLESNQMIKLFGSFKSDTWNESEIIIKQRVKVNKEASITAGGIGTTKVGQHYDIIIHDDMNGPNNSMTPEARQKVIDHYKLNTSILEPGGQMIVIGTRYAADDLIGWILENEIGD